MDGPILGPPWVYSSAVAADPTVRTLTTTLGRSHGVIVRPFADHRGAVVVAPTGLYFVELEPGWLSEPTADWLYRLDQALARPSWTRVVHTQADVADLAAAVAPPKGR